MEYNVKTFKEMLIEENSRHNLVSRKSLPVELEKHIEDSRSLLNFMDLKGSRVVDIGSGAGFPGLVLAIYCPEGEFLLLESDLKKTEFLQAAINRCGLKNCQVLRKRIEEVGRSELRNSFDFCSCRALAMMNIVLEYGLPLLRLGGKLLLWKGKNYSREIEQAAHALDILGGKVVDIFTYSLMAERDRAIVVVEKERETPAKYPRRVGIPAKRPL